MFHLDTSATLVPATLTLLLGRKLVHSVSLGKKYTIPEPVAGGKLVALALLVLFFCMGWEVKKDMSLRDPLMLANFATIGLNANIASLRAGGRVVGIFLIVVVGLKVMLFAIGIGMASKLGLDPLGGLLAGSITLPGGHGTGAAWSKLFIERYGFTNATEVAIPCATFFLVLPPLIFGPVARYLVKKSTTPNGIPDDQEVPTPFEKPDVGRMITSLVLIETIALIAICLTVGKIAAQPLAGTAGELPTFVCVLKVGVILSNGLSIMGKNRVPERAVKMLPNVSLSLFLAMALMGLFLWELASLALPMLAGLVLQTINMALYAIFVTWRMMGFFYDAAVLAAGHCGKGLGATPTAIANMQAITERKGPSHMAGGVVPMVGAFKIDIVNALVIKLYLMLPRGAG
uniref:Sodium/glutamate symporter n=1 Tax=Pseudomonas putida TaxID=303 RepID=J7LEF5_PSEPU|nr:glutamate transporter [Pseudomonas putida]